MDRHTINLEFFASYELFEQIPSLNCKEIAFVGASNSGKSSAINLLANNKSSLIPASQGKQSYLIILKRIIILLLIFLDTDLQIFQNLNHFPVKEWLRYFGREKI